MMNIPATITGGNPPIPSQALCAAEMLEGIELPNGWKVIAKVPKGQNSTGGHFSVPYYVEKTERKKKRNAFLKALNFRRLAAEPDFARAVQQHTTAFNFERETLEFCKSKRLRRIAMLLDAGEYRTANNPLPVCYIIFELAEGGDARTQLAKLGRFNLAWTLRTLHNIAVGLQQLHSEGIAHQDLKPSNILFFEAFGAKLADLGCADKQNNPTRSPRGHLGIPGDSAYAPPELFYGEIAADWKVRRLGCDFYLLGSLIVFFFTGGASMTAVLQSKIHPAHSWLQWTGDYRSVLPYIRDAFEQALIEIESSVPQAVRPQVMEMIRWLCEPDPKRRGHPTDLDRSQFNLERIISAFNVLATKVEYGLFKV